MNLQSKNFRQKDLEPNTKTKNNKQQGLKHK